MSVKKEMKAFEKDTENVIEATLNGLLQGLTGIAVSSKNDNILSVSRMFQKMRGGQFLSILLDEWKKYKEKGKVEEQYQFTEQHKACLQELLEFLDKDSPDEIRFKVLKQIFLVAASEEVLDRESYLPLQFMKIARSLSDGEVILLTTIWQIAKTHEGEFDTRGAASLWIQDVTEKSGMKHKELLEIHEEGLMGKRLLTPRQHADRSGVILKPHYRLTDLGFEFCSFIENYEDLLL